jgi:hypothetical protein
MHTELRGRKTCDRRRDAFLQFAQARVHEGYLPFSVFRLECCETQVVS